MSNDARTENKGTSMFYALYAATGLSLLTETITFSDRPSKLQRADLFQRKRCRSFIELPLIIDNKLIKPRLNIGEYIACEQKNFEFLAVTGDDTSQGLLYTHIQINGNTSGKAN